MKEKDIMKDDTRKLTLVVVCLSVVALVVLGLLPLV